MQKFLRFFVLMAMFALPFASNAQNSWTVADGTTTHAKVPLDFYNCDGTGAHKAQMLYPASLLSSMSGSTIGSITFYHQNTSTTKTVSASTWYIVMGETTETDLSTGFSTANLDTVYSGILQVTNGVFTFDLTSPYTYQGGNLVVEILTNGAIGNYFGSSNQGCLGVDNIGSTYSMMSDPNYTAFLPKTTFTEPPSCFPVTGLAIDATQTTSSSLTLNWNDANNTAASYNVYSITPTDTTLLQTVTATTYTVANLNANTSYVFGVVSDCGNGDLSSMITVSGTTPCAEFEMMPWAESFDNWSSKSACWSFLSGALSGTPTSSSSAWTLNSSYGNDITISGKALTMNVYSTNRYWAVTPPIHITSDAAMLSVDVAVASWSSATPNYDANDTLALLVSTDNGSTFTQLLVADNTQLNAMGANYTTVSVPVLGYNNQNVRFAIFAGSSASGGDNRIVIDNVTVGVAPDCVPVVGLSVSDITAHTATLSWDGDADGYTIWDMSDTSVYQYAIDTTVDLYALNSETQYTFGVTANCGSDESAMRTITFTTLISCPAPTNLAAVLTPGDGTVATLNWNRGGDESDWQICLNNDMTNLIIVSDTTYDFTTLTAEQTYTAKVRAICGAGDTSSWSSEITFTPTAAYSVTVNDGTTTNSYVPVYGNWVDNITKSQFIIPAADLTAMQYGNVSKLTFYSSDANKNWGNASFEVYMTETDGTTLSALADYAGMTQVYTGSLSIVNNVMEITLTSPFQYMGGNLMIGFLQTVSGTYSNCNWYGVSATGASMGGYGSNISQRNFLPKTTIDFVPGETPSCLPVSGLAASNVTADEATLSWTGEATSYNVYVVTPTDTTFYQTVTTNTITITGLDAMTNYTYGVTAVCAGDESDMRYVTFATACSAVSLPYTETFAASSAVRDCWELVSNNTANVGGTNGMGFVTVNGRETLRFSSYSYTNNYDQYGYSPLLTVPTDANNLNVRVVYATYGSSDVLNFGYITATDTVWDPTDYTTTGNSDFQSLSFVIPASATQLAVHYYGDCSYYGWIDSVVVTEMTGDYCAPVTALAVDSVSTTSVSLSWNSDANDFTIIDMADNSVVATSIVNNVTISGLTAGTAYTFGVVVDCGTTTSDTVTIAAMTDCENTCQITIAATDSYGDGWNNSTLTISQNGVIMGTINMAGQGLYNTPIFDTFQVTVCSGMPITFSWTSGSNYDDEAGFDIIDGGNTVVYSVTDASTLTSGAVFYTLNDACPSCVMPVVSVDDVTENSVTISWTGNASNYSIYNGSTYVANATTNTYTFSGLTAATAYTFGVVALCSTDDSSSMGIITISTECGTAAINLPLNETFETNSGTRNCWTIIDGNNDGSTWTTLYNGNDMGMMLSFSYDNPTSTEITPNDWLVTPKLHTTTGSSVTMTWDAAAADNTYYAEHYGVYVSTTNTDTNSFTLVNEWTLTSSSTESMNIDLSAYAGQDIYVAFRHFNCTGQYVLLIDNVNIYEGVYVPDTLTVTVATMDATMGTTNPAPGTYQYAETETVQLSATANTGYHFIGWAYTADGINNDTLDADYIVLQFPASLFMSTGSVTFTALFEAGNPDSTTVTYAVNDSTMGTTIPAPGTYTAYVGSTIQAEAIANNGYALEAWILDIAVNGNIAQSDTLYSYDSEFANPMNFGIIPQSLADAGATITATAVFGIDTNSTPDEVFTLITAVNDSTMGTITPAPGTYTYVAGDSILFDFTAAEGYTIGSVDMTMSIMGITVMDTTFPALYAMAMAQEPFYVDDFLGFTMSLTVNFVADTNSNSDVFTLVTAVNDSTMGTITPAPGTYTYVAGDVINFTVTANEGYAFESATMSVSYMGVTVQEETFYDLDFTTSPLEIDEEMLGFTMTVTVNFKSTEGIENADEVNVNAYSKDGNIVLGGAEGREVYLFDINGRMLNHTATAAETEVYSVPASGVYLIKVDGVQTKRVVVIR